MLHKGEPIPSVTLEDQDGKIVSLSDFKGSPLIVYFYPKDNTKVCTAQACGFRDNYEQFLEVGAEVIGISRDSVASHRKVTNQRKLPFILLSDPKKKAHKAFRVPSAMFGLFPGRVTFVIDKNGRVAHTFRADFTADSHIKEALKVLKELN
ncbi:peroxiredoxin [Ekhidna sp.]|uniref:peroxiredoxin n=1 Tax=Ekhidna sp. TaxID=2608089 RepID=UPI003CCC33D5